MESCLMKQYSNGESVTIEAESETGKGSLTFHPILEGVQLIFHDFHMLKVKSNFSSDKNIFCIDYCNEGRMEQEYRPNTFSYFHAGEFKMDSRLEHDCYFYFPVAHYCATTIGFEVDKAEQAIQKVFPQFPYKIEDIKDKVCQPDSIHCLYKDEMVDLIFHQIHQAEKENDKTCIILKILELLLYLGKMEKESSKKTPTYFSKKNTDAVKAIQQYIAENLDHHITLDYLSEKFQMPLTTMKSCFKEVYGQPVHSYMRSLRMKTACEYLLASNQDIANISMEVGYENPSKFSAAFKREIGMLPIEYRKSNRGGNHNEQ